MDDDANPLGDRSLGRVRSTASGTRDGLYAASRLGPAVCCWLESTTLSVCRERVPRGRIVVALRALDPSLSRDAAIPAAFLSTPSDDDEYI